MPYYIFVLIYLFSCTNQKNDVQKNIIDEKKPIKFVEDIPLPKGYKRIEYEQNSFANFSRKISLTENNTVYLFNGARKNNQELHFAVLNYDIGSEDLQQCADAVMRLHAEYLFYNKRASQISFNFTNGFICDFNHFADGYGVKVVGNNCSWVKKSGNDNSYSSLRKYLNLVYNYAGTKSLSTQLKPIAFGKIEPGCVLLQTGNPYGHAVTIMDMAYNPSTKDSIFLISQSYMPAQSIHVLKNMNNDNLSPWYSTNFEGNLVTPEWIFTQNDLRKF